MEPWAIITLAAVQTLRFLLQKRLSGAGLGAGGATLARFVFAAPLAAAVATLLILRAGEFPRLTPAFWGWALMGGALQAVATQATVALFGMRNFAVGIAFTKTETVMVAALSALLLGEAVGIAGLGAIALGLAGVLALSWPAGAPLRAIGNRTGALGLLAGGAFALSAIGYRGATTAIEGGPLMRAALALAVVTAAQSAGMGLWLRLAAPGTLTRLARAWRPAAVIGVTGFLGSLGWFTAFALQNAAFVRALGQVEIAFSVLASALILHERMGRREAAGIALIAASVVAIVLLA